MRITCIDDQLNFHFPAQEAALDRFAEAHLRHILRRLDVLTVQARMRLEWTLRFGTEGADLLPEALAALGLSKPHGVERLLRKALRAQLEEYCPVASLACMRTLRIPDDGQAYPLPPGLGKFPLRVVERHADRFPASWSRVGGVVMPIYQAEALWLNLGNSGYPFAVKIGAGLVNAVSGQEWSPGLSRDPQGYVVLPEQPWIDGFCAAPGVVRQFVATRLGHGYSAEEQLRDSSLGGVQLEVIPIKPQVFFDRHLRDELPATLDDFVEPLLDELIAWMERRGVVLGNRLDCCRELCAPTLASMGLGAGGRVRQDIYPDPWDAGDWDVAGASRAWVHLCDAVRWYAITGELPPQKPLTAQEYAAHGFPWFEYYFEDQLALRGSRALEGLKSVFTLGAAHQDPTIPQEPSVTPGPVVALGPGTPRLD